MPNNSHSIKKKNYIDDKKISQQCQKHLGIRGQPPSLLVNAII